MICYLSPAWVLDILKHSCFVHFLQIMAEFHRLTEVNLNECIENPMFETIAEMRHPKKSPKWIEQDNKCDKALRLTIQLKKVIVIFFFF